MVRAVYEPEISVWETVDGCDHLTWKFDRGRLCVMYATAVNCNVTIKGLIFTIRAYKWNTLFTLTGYKLWQ